MIIGLSGVQYKLYTCIRITKLETCEVRTLICLIARVSMERTGQREVPNDQIINIHWLNILK